MPEVGEEEFFRLYGRWEPLAPRAVTALFEPMGIPWWIAGGYAMEAFTGVARHHTDIDVSIFRRDLRSFVLASRTDFIFGRSGRRCSGR